MPSVMNYIQQIQDKAASFKGTDTLEKYDIDSFSQVHAEANRLNKDIENICDTAMGDEGVITEDYLKLKAAQQAALQYLNEKSNIPLNSFQTLLENTYDGYEAIRQSRTITSQDVNTDFHRTTFITTEAHSLESFYQSVRSAFENKEMSYSQEMISGEYGLAAVQAIEMPFMNNAGSDSNSFMQYMANKPKPDSADSFSTLFFDDNNVLCSINIIAGKDLSATELPPNVKNALKQTASITLSKNINSQPSNPDLLIYNSNNPEDIATLRQQLNSATMEKWLFKTSNLLNENGVIDYDAQSKLDTNKKLKPIINAQGDELTSGNYIQPDIQPKLNLNTQSDQELIAYVSQLPNDEQKRTEKIDTDINAAECNEEEKKTLKTNITEFSTIYQEQQQGLQQAVKRVQHHKPLKPKEPASKPKNSMSRSSCLQTAGAFLACGATGVLSTGLGAIVGGFVGMALGGPPAAAAGLAIGALAGSAISGVLAKLAGKRAGKTAPDDDYTLGDEEAGRPSGPRRGP